MNGREYALTQETCARKDVVLSHPGFSEKQFLLWETKSKKKESCLLKKSFYLTYKCLEFL